MGWLGGSGKTSAGLSSIGLRLGGSFCFDLHYRKQKTSQSHGQLVLCLLAEVVELTAAISQPLVGSRMLAAKSHLSYLQGNF